MTEIAIVGAGAVSPAGWGAPLMHEALKAGHPLQLRDSVVSADKNLRVRRVPPPEIRPAFLSHSRLRRASVLSHFAVAASLEALGFNPTAQVTATPQTGRTGIVFCTSNGGVIYSRRFLDEVLKDPATASPLLFPETVFNAPASHLATVLGVDGRLQTEIGDSGSFLKAIGTAALWLVEELVDYCLVVAAEEADAVIADGYRLWCKDGIAAEGAGALYLTRGGTAPRLATLSFITDPQNYSAKSNRIACFDAVRSQFRINQELHDLLITDNVNSWGLPITHPSGRSSGHVVWPDWTGRRLCPSATLGEAWAAGGAWQCIEAVSALKNKEAKRVVVCTIGSDDQAIGAVFQK